MAVPSFNTPGEYITFLLTKLERCKSAWEAYGDACSEAYSQAYSTQYAVLKKVQKTLEEEAEQREKVLTFALSLLTVGVGGPIAGAVVRKVAGKIIAKEKRPANGARKRQQSRSNRAASGPANTCSRLRRPRRRSGRLVFRRTSMATRCRKASMPRRRRCSDQSKIFSQTARPE